MNRIPRTLAWLAVATLATAAAAQDVTGAGASFPAPVYAKWADAYNKSTSVKVNYQSIGSGGGIKQITAKTVDFGASAPSASLTVMLQGDTRVVQAVHPLPVPGIPTYTGRYTDTQQELSSERSAYDIRPTRQSGVDLWPAARALSQYAPLVDTLYGSGAYMPMVDGGRYEVRITQNGLIARPTNEAAEEASASGWQ